MKVVVIGGGIMGMLSAWELATAGIQVTLLERAQLGREASWAGGGICSALYPWQMSSSGLVLAKLSQHSYPNLVQHLLRVTGIDSEWRQTGLLVLDQEDMPSALVWGQNHKAQVAIVEAEDLAQLQPGLVVDGSALWLPEIAQIRNSRLLKALALALRKHPKVTIQEACTVTHIHLQQQQVVGVETLSGHINASHVILAAGSWTTHLLRPLGISLDIYPVKGQMLAIQAVPGLLERIILFQDRYMIPRSDGLILVGSTLEHSGYDKTMTEQAKLTLYQWAIERMPALAGYSITHQWAGLRPGTSRDTPIIGPVPGIQGLWVNAGHYRSGITQAPASCRLIADMILDRPPCIDASDYSLLNSYE